MFILLSLCCFLVQIITTYRHCRAVHYHGIGSFEDLDKVISFCLVFWNGFAVVDDLQDGRPACEFGCARGEGVGGRSEGAVFCVAGVPVLGDKYHCLFIRGCIEGNWLGCSIVSFSFVFVFHCALHELF